MPVYNRFRRNDFILCALNNNPRTNNRLDGTVITIIIFTHRRRHGKYSGRNTCGLQWFGNDSGYPRADFDHVCLHHGKHIAFRQWQRYGFYVKQFNGDRHGDEPWICRQRFGGD